MDDDDFAVSKDETLTDDHLVLWFFDRLNDWTDEDDNAGYRLEVEKLLLAIWTVPAREVGLAKEIRRDVQALFDRITDQLVFQPPEWIASFF
ncbi:hypothetical protein [Naasia lichenicola]|uniref:Uncharacterized protein n=1 Tax=Naasia lichenicola TaxID=2565933 RepID=A0A4V6RZ38_9MICO|nr:hypothetical protein [Naasia lichenicola]THG33447.1 hypothetical protein E6C64_03665 [Naasia lichenicola]